MQILYFRDCLGLDPIDRKYYVSKTDINPATGKAYAVNPSSGVWDDNYWAQNERNWNPPSAPSAPSFSDSSAPAAPAFDPIETAKKLLQFNIDANQPAISSLQGQIPEISSGFQTERTKLEGGIEPLKQRYQNLLDELKRREDVQVSEQSRNLSREYGARGIPLSSGLFGESLTGKLNPLREFFTGQTKDVTLGREEGIRGIQDTSANLVTKETEAKRTVQNAIAQLQSGNPQSSIQGAMNLLSIQRQQASDMAQQAYQQGLLGLQQREADLAGQKFDFEKNNQFATLGEGSTLFNLLTGQPVYTNPKTYKLSDQFGDDWD